MLKILVALAALALGGCGFRPATEIAIDPDLPVETQEIVIEAAEALFVAVPELRVPVFIGRGKNGMVSAKLSDKARESCEGGAYANNSLNTFKAPTISPCPGLEFSREEWITIYMHELGHALTATDDHVAESGNVMNASLWEASETVTDLDVEFLRARF